MGFALFSTAHLSLTAKAVIQASAFKGPVFTHADVNPDMVVKAKADKLKKSVEDEIHFLKARVLELESDLVSKSTEVTSAVSKKEEALSSAFAEIDCLKEENSVKT
ncbi:uncharacterized protein LOC131229009 [Magnolia sinica]|uniref:uncharacterized protein LOC131229009 n=1 Tax=Magnolia sinica TaxID=86752 RepID=UPI002658C3FD|nr:uncharacterized protein LOC131229009 [Magnolia sinica]